ncbi:MAG: D-alanine--poly(phosphoribitol) ligase subunit DltA [Sporolactobacillus sp.]
MDIIKMIEKQAAETPERLCFVHRDETLTYRDLCECSDALACWIMDHYPDDRPIIVHGHMGAEMPMLFLACTKAGHAYVPVDLSIPAERVALIAENAQSTLVFTSEAAQLPPLAADCITNEGVQSAVADYRGHRPQSESCVDADDIYYIIYTSGSTGRPKGVQIPRRALESFVAWIHSNFGLSQAETFLNQAPFSFDLSVMDLYPSLISGGTLWAVDKEMIARPKDLFESLSHSGVSVWTSTPSFAEMCLMDPAFSATMLPQLSTFLFCGETLPVTVAKKLSERFPSARMFNTYGPTETTVAVTAVEITADMLTRSDEALPVGSCKPDCRLLILDEDGRLLPEGVKGEIVICGQSVGSGYLGEPVKTAAAFTLEGGLPAYHTKDVGLIRSGMLHYYGRMDHQIKLHGFRMELGEIEHALTACQYVRQALVVPVKKGDRYDHLVAFIARESSPFDADYKLTSAIRKQLAESLPAYMIPRKFVYRESLPMTANGKVDRKTLLAEVAL